MITSRIGLRRRQGTNEEHVLKMVLLLWRCTVWLSQCQERACYHLVVRAARGTRKMVRT